MEQPATPDCLPPAPPTNHHPVCNQQIVNQWAWWIGTKSSRRLFSKRITTPQQAIGLTGAAAAVTAVAAHIQSHSYNLISCRRLWWLAQCNYTRLLLHTQPSSMPDRSMSRNGEGWWVGGCLYFRPNQITANSRSSRRNLSVCHFSFDITKSDSQAIATNWMPVLAYMYITSHIQIKLTTAQAGVNTNLERYE